MKNTIIRLSFMATVFSMSYYGCKNPKRSNEFNRDAIQLHQDNADSLKPVIDTTKIK